MAYHAILGGFHSWGNFAMHALLFAVIAFLLFRTAASRYFRAARPGAG
jgi:hypothetical protein